MLVVAGCPIRNRGWIAARHREALLANLKEAKQLMFHPAYDYYLINDSTDDTALQLASARARPNFDEIQTNEPGWARDSEPRYSMANLARLRNAWLSRAMKYWPGVTHFWCVDSDVLPAVDTLERLLEADKDIVAAPVRNNRDTAFNFLDWDDGRQMYTRMALREKLNPRRSRHGYPWRLGSELFQVHLTGACMLIKREVIDSGVLWAAREQGEDAGFADAALERSFETWIDPGCSTVHWMDPETPLIYGGESHGA